MLPTLVQAEQLLREAEACNPGPWGNHSRVTAHCARMIANRCHGMDGEKAGILGLLHDIGRKFGVRHLGHVSDGYSYMLSLGYDEAARICLTHSFNNGRLEEYIGRHDVSEAERQLIINGLASVEMDDYDRLIQLCDSLAGAEGVLDMEARMGDVKARYGMYPQAKWDKNLWLKGYFEEKMGMDVYRAVGKETFRVSGTLAR